MNICLIRPPTVLRLLSITVKPCPPLGLAFIASALREAGHNVTVIDAIAENPTQYTPFNKDIVVNGLTNREIADRVPVGTDLIGLTIMFTNNWLNDRKLVDFLGDNLPGVPIIAGGEHITGMPERCIRQTRHLTACVLGEGEETVVELVHALENNKDLSTVSGIVYRNGSEPVTNIRRSRVKNVEEIPLPAWDLFPLDTYREKKLSYGVVKGEMSLPIMATRGCPYSCTFCSSPQMWGTRYYMRSPQHVADEIQLFKQKFNATNFDFFDLTAIVKREWIIEFAKELLNRNLNITWQIPAGTRSEAIDAEVARYLYLSGCRNITYAPESGSPEILRIIKKKVVLKRMLQSFVHSNKEKMSIKLNMIIGFPYEKHRHLWQTMKFLVQASWAGVNDIFPTVLVPYSGCEIFNQLLQEGKINPDDDDYYYRLVYSDAFFGSYFYNDNMGQNTMRLYRVTYLLLFYSSSFLFRPHRLFRSLRNILTGRPESRGELGIYQVFKRNQLRYQTKTPAIAQ